MSPTDRLKARAGLEACLRRLRDVQPRFAECAAHALGVFQEGPGDAMNSAYHSRDAAARFLGYALDRVLLAQPLSYSSPPMTHSGPYCLFLRDDATAGTPDPAATLNRQLAALRPIFDALHQVVSSAPPDAMAARLPARVSSWWEALFHLAVHFPDTFLSAGRVRWAAEAVGPPRRGLLSCWGEELIRFGGGAAPAADAVPGAMWVGLQHDVFASTEAAIHCLLAHLAEPAPQAEAEAVYATFTGLRARFAVLARCRHSWQGGQSLAAPRLVKFASTFTTGPTGEWCDFPMQTAFARLLLARCHADAEYLFHRGTPTEEADLWAEAGAALPASIGDGASMFSTAELNEDGGYSFGLGCGTPYLNPDPAARWVRFVFNVLNDTRVDVRWRDKPTGRVQFIEPLYGDAVLNCDFAAASALAIQRAGLVRRGQAAHLPESVDQTATPRHGRGRPRNNKWRLDQSIHDSLKAGESIERLIKEHGIGVEELHKAAGRHRTRQYREEKNRRTK